MKPENKSGTSVYPFETLKFREVLRCLNELSIKVTEADFKDSINPDLVLSIYERFVEIFMDLDRQDYAQPIQEVTDQLQFPELHTDSIPKLVSLQNIFRFMRAVGVHDFAVNDFLQPTRQRLTSIFSGVINFCKFREGRIPIYQQLSARTDELLDKKEELEQQNAVFQQELDVLRATRSEEEPTIQHLMKENETLGQRIVQMNATQEEITTQNRTFKQTTTELQDKTNVIKLEIAEIKKESAYLRANIVESPEKLKRIIDDLGQSIEKSKASIRQAETKQKQLNDELAMLQKIQAELAKLNKMMEEANGARQKVKELSPQIERMKDLIATNEEEMQQLKTNEAHLMRQIENAKDKEGKLKQQQRDKESISAKRTEAALAERAITLEEAKSLHSQIDQTEAASREMQFQLEFTRKQHMDELAAMLDRYNTLEQQLVSYHQRLMTSVLQQS